MNRNSKRKKVKKNKTYKNINKNNNLKQNTSLYSWKNLIKNDCAYVNENIITKNGKKIKKIALEECIIWPTQTADVDEGNPLEYVINTGLGKNKFNRLLDITNVRLKEMEENNIIFQIISPTASGIQNLKERSPKQQYLKAIKINNYMYNSILNYPNNFKAFCTLPMRNPSLAAKELERCVKELGMVGALVNGLDIIYKKPYSSTLPNREGIYYDTKNYDVLWEMFEKLDVPLYIHPSVYNSIGNDYPDHGILNLYTRYPQLQIGRAHV